MKQKFGYVQPKTLLTHYKSQMLFIALHFLYVTNNIFIGKRDRYLVTRLNEQGSSDDQPMYQHLSKCECYNDIVNLMKLPDNDSTTTAIDKREHIPNAVLSNFLIVESCSNWSKLLFLEAFYIKTLAPNINYGLKVSHEL